MKGKQVVSIIVFLSAVSLSYGAVGFGRATVHESHPGKCYNEKDGAYYLPGEHWPMEGCGKITCERFSSSGPLMISFESCGKAFVQPPCYLVQDNTKPYPSCCHQVVCPESNGDEMVGFSSEEEDDGSISVNNNSSAPEPSPAASSSSSSSSVNDLLSVPCCKDDDAFMMNRGERNDLGSLEEQDDKLNEVGSYEIIQPKELPPTFQFATFDDIDHDHDQRLNEVDAQEDYQLV